MGVDMPFSLLEGRALARWRRMDRERRAAARREEAGAVERFVRHHGSAPQGAVTLAAAQLVIARELGFASWPRLKAAVEAHAAGPERRAGAVVAASGGGGPRGATPKPRLFPGLARHHPAAPPRLRRGPHAGPVAPR